MSARLKVKIWIDGHSRVVRVPIHSAAVAPAAAELERVIQGRVDNGMTFDQFEQEIAVYTGAPSAH